MGFSKGRGDLGGGQEWSQRGCLLSLRAELLEASSVRHPVLSDPPPCKSWQISGLDRASAGLLRHIRAVQASRPQCLLPSHIRRSCGEMRPLLTFRPRQQPFRSRSLGLARQSWSGKGGSVNGSDRPLASWPCWRCSCTASNSTTAPASSGLLGGGRESKADLIPSGSVHAYCECTTRPAEGGRSMSHLAAPSDPAACCGGVDSLGVSFPGNAFACSHGHPSDAQQPGHSGVADHPDRFRDSGGDCGPSVYLPTHGVTGTDFDCFLDHSGLEPDDDYDGLRPGPTRLCCRCECNFSRDPDLEIGFQDTRGSSSSSTSGTSLTTHWPWAAHSSAHDALVMKTEGFEHTVVVVHHECLHVRGSHSSTVRDHQRS